MGKEKKPVGNSHFPPLSVGQAYDWSFFPITRCAHIPLFLLWHSGLMIQQVSVSLPVQFLAHWVKDLALPLGLLRLAPWPRTFHIPQV